MNTTDVATDEPILCDGSEGEDDQDVPQSPRPEFSIRDAASASWLVRRINEARSYKERVKLWAEREIRRADRDEQYLAMRYGVLRIVSSTDASAL